MVLAQDVHALVRRCAFLVLTGTAVVLTPELVDNPLLGATLPWFSAYFALLLAPLFWESRPDLFSPVAYVGIMSTFAQAATVSGFVVAGEVRLELVQGLDPESSSALAIQVLQALILGQIGYYVGYYSRWGVPFRRFFPKVAGLEWNRVRVIAIAVLATALFVVAYASFQSRVGLPLFEFTRLDAGKNTWKSDPTLSWMLRGIELGFLPGLLYLTTAVSKKRRLLLPLLGIVAVSLLASRVGQRGTFAFVLLAVAIILHYLYRRIPVLVFCAVYFVGLGASNILHEWRTAPDVERREFALGEKLSHPTELLAEHDAERQRFAAIAVVMDQFPKNYSFLLGKSWMAIVALPIPRWIWPAKKTFFDWQENGIVYKLSGAPAPTPYVGTLYANFSWFGVFMGMLLFGVYHRALYEWLRMHPSDKNVVLLYALMLLFLAPTMLGLSASLQYVVPVWATLRFAGSRPKSSAAQPASAAPMAPATRS